MSTEQALLRIKNAKKELEEAEKELQMEQDKNKVRWYDGIPVLVRDDPNGDWKERFLKQILIKDCSGIYECHSDGYIPGSKDGRYKSTYAWKECKPNYEQPSILVWIPNTGKRPEGVKSAIIKYVMGGNTPVIGGSTCPKDYSWGLNCTNPLLEYAVIEKD